MVTVVSFGPKPTVSLRNMGTTAVVRPYGEPGTPGAPGAPGPNSVPADTAVGTYANTDGSFTANGIDARIDKRMPFTTAEMHGAMADGTSSTPTDNLAALQAGVNALAAAGGGRMICSKGLYGFKGILVVKNGVYIEGPVTRQGPAMTATPSTPGLLALDGTAQLQVGDWASSSNPGGVVNLYVDGNKVGAASTAKTGLVRLAGVSTEIRGLFVHRSGGDGIVVDGLQNSTIIGGFSVGHAGAALVLDNGCGGLSFTGGYYGTSKGGAHLCRDTAGQANLYPFGPTNITFTGTMFESYGGQPAPLDEPHARHVHISGRNLTYVGCNFTGGAQNTAAATVLVDDTVTGGIPATASFDNCIYWARGGYDVVRIAGNSSVAFVGRQESSDDGTNHAASFVCVDGGFPHVAMVGEVLMAGDVDGDLIWRAINSGSMLGTYADQSGGQVYRLNADQSLGIRATGDTINKFQLEGNGTIRWTDGSGGAIAPHTDGLLVAGRTIFSDGVAIVGDTISVTTAAQSVALDAKTAVEWRLSFAATGDGVSALTVANALEGSRLRVGLFGTGVNTMTWATNMSFASTAPQPVDGQAIFVDFEYVATLSKWMETGRSTAVADDTEVAALVTASGSATHAALSATYGARAGGAAGDGKATFTGTADPLRSTTYFGIGAGVGTDRTPNFQNSVVDGSLLSGSVPPGGGNDIVGSQLNVKFQGGFTSQAGVVPDPTYLFGADDYVITGSTSGDLAGIANLYGRLSEVHVNTPGATLTNVIGLQSEASAETPAAGATITNLISLKSRAARNPGSAVVTNSYSHYIDATPTPGATNAYGLYVAGSAKNKVEGPTTLASQAAADTPLTIQLPLSASGQALSVYDVTLTNRVMHITPNGSIASASFITGFEGNGGATALGFAGPSGEPGIGSATGTSDLKLYRSLTAGRGRWRQTPSGFNPTTVGDAPFTKTWIMVGGAGSSQRWTGTGTGSNTGTITQANSSATQPQMLNVAGAASASAVADLATSGGAGMQVFRGASSDLYAGFIYKSKALYPDASYNNTGASTGARLVAGLVSSLSTAMGSDRGGSTHSAAFMRSNVNGGATDSNWQFVTNNAGTPTVVDTGMAFTVSHLYEFTITCAAGGTSIGWQVDDLTAGTTRSGTASSTLPGVTTGLFATAAVSTVDAVARNVQINYIWLETDKG